MCLDTRAHVSTYTGVQSMRLFVFLDSYVHDCVTTTRGKPNLLMHHLSRNCSGHSILHSGILFIALGCSAGFTLKPLRGRVTPAFLARHSVILRKYKEWAASVCGPPPSQGPQEYARDGWEFPRQLPCLGGSEPISYLPSWQQLPKVWPLACLPYSVDSCYYEGPTVLCRPVPANIPNTSPLRGL